MELLDGKRVKLEILNNLKKDIDKLERKLGLVVIQVGDDPASQVYVNQKKKMAETLGINFYHISYPDNIDEAALLCIIDDLNGRDCIDGILVQMPLPKHLDSKKIQNAISPYKDVDGLTDINMGKLAHNVDSLVPCTPQGIMDLLDNYNISVSGKNVTIIGRSDLVGKPLQSLMTNNDATVTLCHSKTENLKLYTTLSDILVVAVGRPKLIKEDFIKDKAVIIDVGINRTSDGLVGDVDFDSVKEKASFITPVPGGVGQMTVAELGKNTYKAYCLRKEK